MASDRRQRVPFNRPQVVGREPAYIAEAIAQGQLSAGGVFSAKCCDWLEVQTGCQRALLVHSATAALEMAALLLDIGPGDEVLMPSFGFVSAANAVALRRGTPVFVDIRADTLNLDENLVEEAVTARTRAILPVHYAGVPCEMDRINGIAGRHDLHVIEDAAQALGSTYRDRPAGNLGDLAAVSFHETKNVTSGEGGALLISDPAFSERAEILRDKGTDRSRFFRGEIDKYSWVDLGSSYALSELNAAFLWAQLEAAGQLAAERLRIWELYHEALEPLEHEGRLRRPAVPAHVRHNAHIYYVLLDGPEDQRHVLAELNARGINAVFHFVPLHLSQGGRRFGRESGPLPNTEATAEQLIRLPIWSGMSEEEASRVVETLAAVVHERVSA